MPQWNGVLSSTSAGRPLSGGGGQERRQQFIMGEKKSRRRTTHHCVLWTFVSLVLACCVFNLKLHSDAVGGSYRYHRWSEYGGDPMINNDNDDGIGKGFDGVDVDDDDDAIASAGYWRPDGTNAATLSPTTAATWSPTSSTWSPTPADQNQNQASWAPTYQHSTMATDERHDTTIKQSAMMGALEQEDYEEQSNVNDLSQFDDKREMSHPRLACFIPHFKKPPSMEKGTSCNFDKIPPVSKTRRYSPPSIPLEAKALKEDSRDDKAEGGEDDNEYIETDTCKYPDPERMTESIAPPTCNDIHALGFDLDMFRRDYVKNNHDRNERRPSTVKYITMGGAKCVWKVNTTLEHSLDETVIFKSHKHSRFLKRQFWDQNRRDALISGGLGNTQLLSGKRRGSGEDGLWNHILPMYHYCALANIVPYAADGNLMEYIQKDKNKEKDEHDNEDESERKKRKTKIRRRFGPVETLKIALQVARGLYQAQLYWDGRPTFVHADLNPSQFLVFTPPPDDGKNTKPLPRLQINDFNQGRFLIRSTVSNTTCPFRSCSKNLRGNRYHTPERFNGCVDQNEYVDSWALGGVFYFLLTDGLDPYYDVRSYDKVIKRGDLPNIPNNVDRHPAYDALKEVMEKCMASELEDRPSSLQVVHMLEKRLEQIANDRR